MGESTQESFEHWARLKGHHCRLDDGGLYVDPGTHWAWQAWQEMADRCTKLEPIASVTKLPSRTGSPKLDWHVGAAVRVGMVLCAQPEAAMRPLPAGLSPLQEPKYTTDGASIINRASGKPIPAEEPVFIFRARDRKALVALSAYAGAVSNTDHFWAVKRRMDDFRRFESKNPTLMKDPDTQSLAEAPAW